MNKFLRLLGLLCFTLNIQGMEESFSKEKLRLISELMPNKETEYTTACGTDRIKQFPKLTNGELRKLILKSLNYSTSFGFEKRGESITLSTHLVFLNSILLCNFNQNETEDSCSIINLETCETFNVYDEEAREYMIEIIKNRSRFHPIHCLQREACLEYDRRKLGVEEYKRLLARIDKIKDIEKTSDDEEEYIEIKSERLKCKKNRVEISCFSKDRPLISGFEGSAIWNLFAERLENQKETEMK